MTIKQFSTSGKQQQQEQLLKYGTFLAERNQGHYRIMLYALENFYVEIFFMNNSNKISWLKCFDGEEELAPYLQQINLNGLFQEALS